MNYKILAALVLNLLISVPTYATAEEQKELKFSPNTEALYKGDVHYALDIVTLGQFNQKYPDLYDLDSLGFLHDPHVRIVVAKTAFIVNKPAGFFDHETMGDEKFVSHLMGQQKIKKTSPAGFKITVPGEAGHTYQLKSYFDSDEISTLPNSKVIRAVAVAKRLDVISQSSSSTIFRELTHFSKYSTGGVQVSSYIPLNENKTLVLTYHLTAVKKFYALEKLLKKSLSEEAEAQKHLIENYGKSK